MSVSNINNNIRIRTTPLGSDKYLKVNLNQNFDFLEILSLKIGQEEIYKQYCSDYGVIAGRVIVNGGVGVPNAKVSVFIPISEIDKENSAIRAIYPYETLESVDFNNIKYNLLLETPRQDDLCHRSVGTFPEKRRILDCDPWCEIYGKYYKFTTSTNASGDYIIFGVPTGVQTVHMDVDLSDIGYLSQKPYDMVGQGSPITMFDSLNQFKTSPNLAQLPQVKTQNKTINVLPFWGDLDQCEVGVNRVDFDLNYKIIPSAFFVGSIFGDSNKNSVNKRCRPRRDLGLNGQLSTGEGVIQMLRFTPNGSLEYFDINGGRVIDEDGTWVVQLPMNLDSKITDEFGDLVDSGNPEVGIATKAKYRFKIGLNENGKLGRLRTNGKFLVPNYGDYTFDENTPEFITIGGLNYSNFAEMEWNGIYTVKQFISRFSKKSSTKNKTYTGIKDTGNSGNINPFPYNEISKDLAFLFIFLCIITNIIGLILAGINAFISIWNGFCETLGDIHIGSPINWSPFEFMYSLQIPCVKVPLNEVSYCPGCDTNKKGEPWCQDDLTVFLDAATNALATSFDVFKYNFIEDWINGTLYAFSFKLKDKQNGKSKFCNVDSTYGTNYVNALDCGASFPGQDLVHSQSEGLIKYYEGEYFYAPENPYHNWLYPTDIYNLGSMKSCDVFGKPKIVLDIPPTTFNTLTEDFGQTICDEDGTNCYYEQGTEPFFIDIGCFSVTQDASQCFNVKAYCELGVDYDEDLNQHDILQNEDISDVASFGPSFLRGQLECLNVPSICEDCAIPPEGQFTIDWENYRTGNLLYPGQNYSPNGVTLLYRRKLIRNSFYFYFGIVPGKTAIDKLLSQYFAPCERTEPCPIFISGSVVNNTCLSGNTGSITASPKYGTPPYRYDWYQGYYLFGGTDNQPFSINGSNTINNLYSDIYTVVVTDSVGNICKRSFTVLDPSPFTVTLNYSPYICKDANNGYVIVTPAGGTPPYYIDWGNGADVTQFTGNTTGSFFLTNLYPTSNCTPSFTGTNVTSINLPSGGSGSGGSGSGSGVSFTVIRNYGTIPALNFFSQHTSNLPVRFDQIYNNVGNGYGNNTTSPVAQSNSFFTAPVTGVYQFQIEYGQVDVTVAGGSFSTDMVVYNNSGSNILNTYSEISSFNSTGTIQGHVVTFPPIALNVGERVSVDINFDIPATVNDTFGDITWKGDLLYTTGGSSGSGSGSGGSGSGIGSSSLYQAVIWDSSNGCLNSRFITVDITQSCGFTLTATSINDYCDESIKSSITAGVTGGGVPPFTFTIQSNDTGYFWSGKTSNTEIIKKGMEGLTSCPGATYNITCIDSCGSSGKTSVNIVKSKLRALTYAGQATYRNQELTGRWCHCNPGSIWCSNGDQRTFYVSLFATSAPPTNVALSNTCPTNSNGSGYYWSVNSSFNTYSPPGASFWHVLPPDPISSSNNAITSSILLSNNNGSCDRNILSIKRTHISPNQSQIDLTVLNLDYPDINSGNKSWTICSSETVYLHEIFLNIIGDCVKCNWTIKTTGCSVKLEDHILC